MSYNIDSCEYIGGQLWIKRNDAMLLAARFEDELSEGCFLNDVNCGDLAENVAITPDWYGEGSGHTYDTFKEVLGHTIGSADILITWEGGDSHSGLRVENGVVTEKKVVFSLGEDVG